MPVVPRVKSRSTLGTQQLGTLEEQLAGGGAELPKVVRRVRER